jgi:dipeptidyl aminopeptidase/acylaminoacyl peptidase
MRSFKFVLAGVFAGAAVTITARAQIKYQTPSPDLVRILEAPSTPVAAISPNRQWILVTSSDPRTITIREMAEPAYFLAGSKVPANPDAKIENVGIVSASVANIDGSVTRSLPVPAGGRLGSTAWSRDGNQIAFTTIDGTGMQLHVMDLATGRSRRVSAPNLGGKLGDLSWSNEGTHVAFTSTTPAGVSLWLADPDGAARRLTPPVVSFVSSSVGRGSSGACAWVSGRAELLCRLFSANHGAPPKISDVPTGPIVQESFGRSAPARTYEYLLSSPDDEKLFDYYFTDQLALVSLTGKITNLGRPGIHVITTPSPDGNYFLVRAVQRPYSYQVPLQSFPSRTEVWDRNGKVVREITASAVAQDAPSMRDAVSPGIRNVAWRPDVPATLVMAEALDNGDPRVKVAKRDRVSLLAAPFNSPAVPLFETEYRYGGITWAAPNAAIVIERLSRGARQRAWLIDPSAANGGAPRLIFDRSSEDRYNDPGSWVTIRDPATNRETPLRSSDGKYLYLTGDGASPEGDRPFLDRFEIATGKTTRLWQSSAPYYESVLTVVDPDARRIITRRESPTEPTNYFVRDLQTGKLTKLTKLGDPLPFFAGVKSELITYSRPDGIKLSATMYLPPGYDKSQGPLPFLFWAYPREFQSDSAASQISGSPYQFKRPSRANYMMMLLQGYGVLDNPAMPIIGRNGKEPNDTYVEQLVADAQAAADKIVALGVADRNRLAIGGHSYGAFMTVNLLAHSDIFRTGIAESGAYNRTLTPFGFQAEPRNYWEAQDVYNAMSPFNYADKINEPVLLIHGQRDDNSGTFPINSERLFAAIKGLGGSVRYVQLPLEPHGYTAIETQRHLLWEYVTWLDKYVKNAAPRKQATE